MSVKKDKISRRDAALSHLYVKAMAEAADAAAARLRAAAHAPFEPMEGRQLMSASVQFTAGAETVNATAGTFSIPVTETGTPAPAASDYATGINNPGGVAVDAAGNVYTNETGTGNVLKLAADGTKTTFATGSTSGLQGLTFDASGNLYVSQQNANTILKVTPNGTVSTFTTGVTSPTDLTFDPAGNLYAATATGGVIDEVTPGGTVTTYASGLGAVTGVAFDGKSGVLYASTGFTQRVVQVAPNGGAVTDYVPARSISTPSGLDLDAAGNLYVDSSQGKSVVKIAPGGVASTFISLTSQATQYNDVKVAPDGDLFVSMGAADAKVVRISDPGHRPVHRRRHGRRRQGLHPHHHQPADVRQRHGQHHRHADARAGRQPQPDGRLHPRHPHRRRRRRDPGRQHADDRRAGPGERHADQHQPQLDRRPAARRRPSR